MIQFNRPPAPNVLVEDGKNATDKLCKAHETDEDYRTGKKRFQFEARKHGKHLYAHDEVKQALRAAQYDKCAFCESKITHISFGDIEHFRPKGGWKQHANDDLTQPGYYWLAYAWDNLLLSCQLCNERFKENLFPLDKPENRVRSHLEDLSKEKPLLIDPSAENPARWIGFHGPEPECPHPVRNSKKGKTTIEVFGLDREELVELRRARLNDFKILLELRDSLRASDDPAAEHHRVRIDRLIAERTHCSAEYSAMCTAYLQHSGL